MNVIFGAKLASVVITPRENPVVIVNNVYKATSHCHLVNTFVKVCFDPRLVYSTLEERCISLNTIDNPRPFLIVLNESVRRPRALRPPPEQERRIIVHNDILTMIGKQFSDISMLQIGNGFIIMNILQFICDTKLALEVKTACVKTSVVNNVTKISCSDFHF
jgi:hypothetical protein